MIHHLKTWPEYYEAVLDGTKSFEVRKDDRDFQVGDLLVLLEYDPDEGEFTGRKLHKKISYKLGGGSFGINEDFCVLGIKDI